MHSGSTPGTILPLAHVALVPTYARDNGSPECIACPMYSLLLDQQSALVVGARTALHLHVDASLTASVLWSYLSSLLL